MSEWQRRSAIFTTSKLVRDSVEIADGEEATPHLAKCEAKLLVIRDRAVKIVDKKMGERRT